MRGGHLRQQAGQGRLPGREGKTRPRGVGRRRCRGRLARFGPPPHPSRHPVPGQHDPSHGTGAQDRGAFLRALTERLVALGPDGGPGGGRVHGATGAPFLPWVSRPSRSWRRCSVRPKRRRTRRASSGPASCGSARRSSSRNWRTSGESLCGCLGPTLVRQEAFQTAGLKLAPRLVDGRAGEPKLAARPGDRIAVLCQGPQGLVLELEQVLRVEELGVLEQRVADLAGPGLKVPVACNAWRLDLGSSGICVNVFMTTLLHLRHRVKAKNRIVSRE